MARGPHAQGILSLALLPGLSLGKEQQLAKHVLCFLSAPLRFPSAMVGLCQSLTGHSWDPSEDPKERGYHNQCPCKEARTCGTSENWGVGKQRWAS